MKNYFKFTLKAEQLLPIWLIFIALVILPYIYFTIQLINKNPLDHSFLSIFGAIFLIIIMALLIPYFIIKMIIENLVYKGKSIKFTGDFGTYIGIVLLGLFLSAITIGIYSPWFIRNVHKFFINNSSLNDENFEFKGDAGKLLVYILLSFILPIFVVSALLVQLNLINNVENPFVSGIIQQLVNVIIMGPYMYLVYRWAININYKNYNIRWETNFWDSVTKIILEFFLSLITLGIYYPMAIIKLYSYFTNRTVAYSNDESRKFGFDENNFEDYLFILIQALLTIVTIGIYYPWAICKIGSRILSRTYLEESKLINEENLANEVTVE